MMTGSPTSGEAPPAHRITYVGNRVKVVFRRLDARVTVEFRVRRV